MSEFEFAYTLWVFLSTLGVVQYVAVQSRLWGLVLFRRRPAQTRLASILLIIAAFTWFFASADRNVPDTTHGLDGVVQARWFAIGAGSAIALVLALSSLINHRWGADHGWDSQNDRWPPAGLTWLERTTFLRALGARLAAIRRGRTQWTGR